ncbi:diguanylate cyclase domain-containing protein [Ectopseudomonas mendocina]|uniref:diguanylate cyclase domain-containing protein n=1 Tax=Ectopseudomonas mendocina TaxID=300 RepID=UPI000A644D91
MFDDHASGLLLATPQRMPEAGQCPLPMVLLLEDEPTRSPVGVSDWLVRQQSPTSMSCAAACAYAREQGNSNIPCSVSPSRDPLTGIANRQGFQTLLAARLAECGGRGLVLGHLDLDNFRHANDALGYQGGDRLILQVVARLKGLLQPCDQLARLGSDEFALLLDVRRDPRRVEHLVERVTEVLGEPYWVDGESLLIGCSLGLAHARAGEGADPLLWHAHIAMQHAKSQQGCVFTSMTSASTVVHVARPIWRASCAARCVGTSWSCTTSRAFA